MEIFNSDTDINNIDPDAVIGRGAVFTCSKCGAQAPSIIFEDVQPPLPEGWYALEQRDINGRQGYLCPNCFAEHAEWQTCIKEEDSGFVHCSKCHAEFRIDDLERVGDDKGVVNYCPACGTKMIRKRVC